MTLFTSHPSGGRPASLCSNKTTTSIAAIAFVRAALFLFPSEMSPSKALSSKNGNQNFISFTLIAKTWAPPFFILFQFYPRDREIKRMSGMPRAPNPLSLALQVVVILAIAVR